MFVCFFLVFFLNESFKVDSVLALQRQRRILDLLAEQGSLLTRKVALTLKVTEETVRRDFEKLEAEGVLLRSHGGAVRLDATRRETPASERETQNAEEKRRIAEHALRHIQSGQTVFFDPSTTVLHLARLLPDLPLTVLTNSLPIALVLAGKPAIHTVLLGGNLMPTSGSCTGWPAEQTLDAYRVDRAFVSCRGLDPVNGLSEASEEQARLKRRVIERAEATCLLADQSKVGLRSNYFYAKLSDVDTWITDIQPPASLRKTLTSLGLQLEIAP